MVETRVIAVDLDGTLTLTDTLYEAALVLARSKPIMLFLLPFWLVKSVAYFKLKVAENSVLDVTTLPYNAPFIDWLKEQKASGKEIVLCTAANELIARNVYNHFDLFDDFIASDETTNLKSANKRKELEDKYGEHGYDYAGNSSADLEVWAGAAQAIVVNASVTVLTKASKVASVSETFPSENPNLSVWLKALRVHQWLKNLLLFVPLLAAHQFGNFQSLATLTLAFISFSLCASSVYIINDLLDLESDRRHPRKKNRPFASAKLPISLGLVVALALIGSSVTLGAVVGEEFLVILLLYLSLTVAYSMALKRLVLIDCLTLATLYTVRIIAGAVAVSVSLSFWLLAFSVFMFFSLALVKRYAELKVQILEAKSFAHGRGYVVSDAPLLQTLGVTSGYISALVLALYVQSEDIVSLYAQPLAIWLVLPILLFWVSWVWLKAERGEMHDDPIVFAASDKASLVVTVLTVVVFIYAATGMTF
jgi:4-hydroxybenzoate polyprenyltransferase/phosphoserine phosphatase